MTTQAEICPFCNSNQGCEHLLVCIDTTFKQAEGGVFWEDFNHIWNTLLNSNLDNQSFDQDGEFTKLINELHDIADKSSEWEFDDPHQEVSSKYLIFWVLPRAEVKERLDNLKERLIN